MVISGSCTTMKDAATAPASAPPLNHFTMAQSMCERVSHERLPLEPSCTSPCTGINAATGTTVAMVASNITPPPTPNEAVIIDVRPARIISPSATAADTAPPPVNKSVKLATSKITVFLQ